MSKFLTEPECVDQREYANIPAWQQAGYTGKGLSVFLDDVDSNHVGVVGDIIQVILPDVKIYSGSIGYSQTGTEITNCMITCTETRETMPFDDFIKKYNISMINNSTNGGDGDTIMPIAKFMKEKIKKYNLIFCGASGNQYKGRTTQGYNGACIVVGSANLRGGVPQYGLKSIGPNVDFVAFHGFQSGSSFSSPFLLAMAGLLRSKYPNITQEEVYEYFKSHCEDINNDGKDIYTGWGLPIMGDVKTTIKLQIGKSTMIVDGMEKPLDQPPIIDRNSGRTLVPIRDIAEALSAEVGWDEKTKTITIER